MQGLSIACSTPHAISWDDSWADSHEISGRAMVNVHDAREHSLQPDAGPPDGLHSGTTAAEATAFAANGLAKVMRVHRSPA